MNSCFQFRTLDTIQGLVPICIHVDGAEFYSNSEVLVWSMQSVFSSGQHVWDSKYPLVVIPHEMIRDADIKQQVQEVIAQVLKWSFRCCAEGVWPSTGPFGEALPSGHRSCQKGKPLAGGAYRACYFGFRADGKGRKEAHMFPRSYLHSFICEACYAQREHKDWDCALSYKNFYQSAAYRLTTISSTLSCFFQSFTWWMIWISHIFKSQPISQLLRPHGLHQQWQSSIAMEDHRWMAPWVVLSRSDACIVLGNMQGLICECFGVLGTKWPLRRRVPSKQIAILFMGA